MNEVRKIFCALVPVAVWVIAPTSIIAAPTVWTGPTISFAKPSGANHLLPVNQDHLTPNVALTRGSTQGIFNILAEASFSNSSPTGTRWATALNNPGDTIAATNWAALDFSSWATAYNNSVGPNILNHDAVVHLVADDIFLNLRFTGYQGGGSGGGFAYQRSTQAPEPAASALILLTIAILPLRRSNLR